MEFYSNKNSNITFSIRHKTLSFSNLIGGYSRELHILFAIKIRNVACLIPNNTEIYHAGAKCSQLKYPAIYHLGQVDQEICCFNRKKTKQKPKDSPGTSYINKYKIIDRRLQEIT